MRAVFSLAFLAAMAACSTAPAAPAPGGELLVMNDGMKPVTEVRLRRAGAEGDWSANLLGDEPIEVREGRRLDIGRLGLGCQVEVRLVVAGLARPVDGEQAVCAEPRFWVGFALGLDEPGRGRRARFGAVRGETEGAPSEAPAPRPSAAAPRPDLGRGLPLCPGDPRCRKKK